MPVLQLHDQQFALPPAPIRIGTGADANLTLPSSAGQGVQAVIEQVGGSSLVIRRAIPSALVRVNGVVLGAEPTPLMHGDKVEIGGLELRYAEDAKGGATQFVNAGELAAMVGARRGASARATAASGGRLVSLVDGKEYLVPAAGVVIGREASCDIVVGQNEVSRRHAEITPDDAGYLVRDMSANGVFVNGERVQGSRRLMRADVLRIGGEEFRFYADLAPAAGHPAAGAGHLPVDPPTTPSPRQVAPPAESHAHATAHAPAPAPASPASPASPATAPADDARPVLATLESLNEGPGKGTRHPLRSALSHVGRGAHNDVRLQDESVSETHAKLQRREDGWYLVDMDSTNGSYVGGTRVKGERRIEGSPDLRFGGVKMRFLPAAAAAAAHEGKETRAIAAVERARVPASSAAAPVAEQPAGGSGGVSAWVWVIVLAVAGAVAFFVLRGRA